MNKSSKDKDNDDTNSARSSRSGSESEESQVFVRTKAAPVHHESSTDDQLHDGYDTMKHNDQNIIASGRDGDLAISNEVSKEESMASEAKSTLL